jgi:drug/metabolite transporter (DMT)-like permease
LRESSIIIGSLFAYLLFREAHLARRIVGAVVVLIGIAAISL